MRTLLTLALVAVPMMAAAPSRTAQANVKVDIVAPCHIQASGELNFGKILMDSYDAGGVVSVIPTTTPNGTSSVAATAFAGCAAFKNDKMTVAEFHYRHDARYPVSITIEDKTINPTDSKAAAPGATVNMSNGLKLGLFTDAPADACGLFDKISGVEDKHFGVGGALLIPAGTFGPQTGIIHVAIAYL